MIKNEENEKKGEKEEEVWDPSSSSCSQPLDSKEKYLGTSQTEESEEQSLKEMPSQVQKEKFVDVKCSEMTEEEYEDYLNISDQEIEYLESADVLNAHDLYEYINYLKVLRKYLKMPPAADECPSKEAERDINICGVMLRKMPDNVKQSRMIKRMVWWYFKRLYRPTPVDLFPATISEAIEGEFYRRLAKDRNRVEWRDLPIEYHQYLEEKWQKLKAGETMLSTTPKRRQEAVERKKQEEMEALEEYDQAGADRVLSEVEGLQANTDIT